MKTILTILFLTLSASATAQTTIRSMQHNSADNTVTYIYTDGYTVTMNGRERPTHPDTLLEREAVAEQLAERQAYYSSEEYLKERCTAEGNKVFRQSFMYGKYWHYANAPGSMNACKEYWQAKRARKLANKKAP